MTVTWVPVEPPLAPVAVAGRDAVGARLGERASRPGTSLRVSRAGAWTVVVGPAEELPWADGAIYLGRLPGADATLVPVHRMPQVPTDLLQQRLVELCAPVRGSGSGPTDQTRPPAAAPPNDSRSSRTSHPPEPYGGGPTEQTRRPHDSARRATSPTGCFAVLPDATGGAVDVVPLGR